MSLPNGNIFDDLAARFKVKPGDDMSPNREKLFIYFITQRTQRKLSSREVLTLSEVCAL